jgi:hypothetical protein
MDQAGEHGSCGKGNGGMPFAIAMHGDHANAPDQRIGVLSVSQMFSRGLYNCIRIACHECIDKG